MGDTQTLLTEVAGQAGAGVAPIVDPRPTDLTVFYDLLSGAISGFAGKSTDTVSAIAMAMSLVREAVGQCIMLGIAKPMTRCNDGTPLGTMPAGRHLAGVQQPVTQQTAPGVGTGGMVSQHPTHQGPPQGQPLQNFGDGSRGVMVAQYPNEAQPRGL